jgi:hypothetical protein
MSVAPYLIEVDLKTPEQMFNSLDPSPFHERDLDEKAERFIVGWAREANRSEKLQLVVNLPRHAQSSEAARRIPDAIHNHFSYRELQARQDLRELLRFGRYSLTVGLLVLVMCFIAIRTISMLTDTNAVTLPIVESLLILGWVANWRPLEIFLYDWWPARRQVLLFQRLSTMPVEVRLSSMTNSVPKEA